MDFKDLQILGWDVTPRAAEKPGVGVLVLRDGAYWFKPEHAWIPEGPYSTLDEAYQIHVVEARMDKTILSTELRHGDVLCYTYRTHQSIFARGIRLITGSQFVHVGVVLETPSGMIILEQLGERAFNLKDLYHSMPGEDVFAVRPRFTPFAATYGLIDRSDYGYLAIVDCLLNHALARLTFGAWKYRPVISRLQPNRVMCSTLVAQVLKLPLFAPWCKHTAVVEPDDFFNHTETFEHLGYVQWVR